MLLESFGALTILAIVRRLEQRMRESSKIPPLEKEKFQHYLNAAKGLSPFLEQFHKTLFYLFGVYYNFSKRCTGITYVSLTYVCNVSTIKIINYTFLDYIGSS